MTPDVTAVGGWLIGAAAVAAALLGLWKLAVGLWRLARRIGHFLDDWGGEPARPGHPARPGAMERLASVESQMGRVERRTAAIEHELHPNSGASLRDAVDRVEQQVGSAPTDHTES